MGKFKGIICAVAFAAFSMTAAGCDEADDIIDDDGDAEFNAIDTSNDGLVSGAEWNAAFDAWDVNADGVVDQNEYLLDDGFGDLDGDANAVLTDAEWNSAMVDWDLDDNGFLDEDEMFI